MYEFMQIDELRILPFPSFGSLNIALPRCLLHLRSNGVLATDKISPLWLEKLLKGMYLSALICTKWSKSPDFPKRKIFRNHNMFKNKKGILAGNIAIWKIDTFVMTGQIKKNVIRDINWRLFCTHSWILNPQFPRYRA